MCVRVHVPLCVSVHTLEVFFRHCLFHAPPIKTFVLMHGRVPSACWLSSTLSCVCVCDVCVYTHRSTAFVLPTAYALVELTEMPFTVVTLSEIEVCVTRAHTHTHIHTHAGALLSTVATVSRDADEQRQRPGQKGARC